MLQYMDRTYVTQQHKTPVFQLGLDLWREQVRWQCQQAAGSSVALGTAKFGVVVATSAEQQPCGPIQLQQQAHQLQ
jgi:hypothetical protein